MSGGHFASADRSLQYLDSGLGWTIDSSSLEATQPLLSALTVIISCLAIILYVTSASGMEHAHGYTKIGKDYSNTTVNSQLSTSQVFVTITAE